MIRQSCRVLRWVGGGGGMDEGVGEIVEALVEKKNEGGVKWA